MLPPTPGPTLALQLPQGGSPRQGYHINVLGSSLVARLKQRQIGEPPRQPAKPPRATKSIVKKDRVTLKYRLDLHDDEDGQSSDDGQSNPTRRPRANSATSGETLLPRLASSGRSQSGSRVGSRVGSRRSIRSVRSLSAAQARADSRRSAAASAVGLGPRAPTCPVHVVKKDGVFQPADKYMPGRLGIREGGEATLWDYHTYVLPVLDPSNESCSPRLSEPEFTPGLYLGSGKKRMKVSWKAASMSGSELQPRAETSDGIHAESRQENVATPSAAGGTPAATPNKHKRAQSVDNLAFRRPVYSSGKSRVSSIGLKWKIPAVSGSGSDVSSTNSSTPTGDGPAQIQTPAAANTTTPTTLNTPSKPMWSYLITQETKHVQLQAPNSLPSQPSPVMPPKPKIKDGAKPSHRRDVHPVSTAMERAGMSMSKTRWTVPSSSASGLEAERAVRERLQLVKRSGALLLYEPGGRGTSNSAAQRFRQAMAAAGRVEEIGDGDEDGDDGDEDEEETDGSPLSRARGRAGKGEECTQGTASTIIDDKAMSTRDDDRLSSPTKSRSTFYN